MAYVAVGKQVPPARGADKVTGRTMYAGDVTVPGTLWARVLRSPLPHARIVSMDTSRARALPGVSAVLSGGELPPVRIGQRMRDMPLLAAEKVRFAGESVAAVAAEDPDTAEEALGLIDVGYDELPSIYDAGQAMRPGAPPVHRRPAEYQGAPPRPVDLPNLQSYTVWERGDLEEAFRLADVVLEHTFRTPLTHHGYLEPHACTVWVHADGEVEVWASTKTPYRLREVLAEQLDAGPGRVRVHIPSVGGDFGGKDCLLNVPLCYLLSERTRRPVKLVFSQAEELTASHHRHPTAIRVQTGVKADGTLCGMRVGATFSGGAYAAFKVNPQVTVLGPRQAGGAYRIPAIRIEEYCVYTNQVPCTQTRAPGAPQIVFAVESHLDLVARELRLDPVEFRFKNLLEKGESSPLGHKWSGIRAKETLRGAIDASTWQRPKPSPRYGRGVAMYERGAATGKSSAAITVGSGEEVSVLVGAPDCGPGIYTVVQQVVAEVLQVPAEQVQVRVDDTDAVPYDAGVGGSKSTNSTGHAALKAAREAVTRLQEVAAARWRCQPEQVQYVAGRFTGPGEAVISLRDAASLASGGHGEPFSHVATFEPTEAQPVTSFCAQVAEVEVDPYTGEVRLQRLVTAHDVGRVLNPVGHRGQIAGGVAQGLGFALIEETPMVDGRIATPNLGEFKIPAIGDIPRLETVLLEEPAGPVPYQGKAIGENPNVPTAAAIANAVHDAIGVRIFELPITAEKVFQALRQG